MKKKLFVAIYTLGIVLAVVFLNVVATIIQRNPSTPLSREEMADVAIAQYDERANSTTGVMSVPFFLLSYLFPRSEALDEGCSLRFSHAPMRKAVEPQGNIEYAITILNRGREVCKNVSLSIYYRNEETYVSSDPKPTASDYYWTFGDLASGKSTKLTLTTKTSLPAGGQLVSEGCVTADNGSDVCSQNIIFVAKGASLRTMLREKINIPRLTGAVWGGAFRSREFGIWVWDSPKVMTPAHASNVITVARQNGFNVIYVTVDDYLELAEISNENERETLKDEYMLSLSVFVEAAKQAGISVDVVGGAKDWAMPDNRWKGYALIDFLKEYNERHGEARVRGLQYDVEPYLLGEYNTDKRKILKEYVEFIDESAKRMAAVDAKFTIVIPHFYDNAQAWTPSFSYEGEDAHTFTHLLRALKQKDDTSVIIMAYRNFFEDENGTRQIAEEEVKEASDGGYGTNIIIAQETGNVPPAYVTFYDYPKVSLYDALSEIQEYFKRYQRYGGVAIHYFDPFLKME